MLNENTCQHRAVTTFDFVSNCIIFECVRRWKVSLIDRSKKSVFRTKNLIFEKRVRFGQTFLGRGGRSGSVDGNVESSGDEAIVLRPNTHSGGSVNRLARLREDRMLWNKKAIWWGDVYDVINRLCDMWTNNSDGVLIVLLLIKDKKPNNWTQKDNNQATGFNLFLALP